eukprot:GHVR01062465.1.p1 GENE.GHVR01062465.1~~GHVR01062465.1.p1  ORF type:complete len:309 (+),score=1.86 GHVR01062465.1:203-1129(+)
MILNGFASSVALATSIGLISVTHASTVALVNTGMGLSGIFSFFLGLSLSALQGTEAYITRFFISYSICGTFMLIAVSVFFFFRTEPCVMAAIQSISVYNKSESPVDVESLNDVQICSEIPEAQVALDANNEVSREAVSNLQVTLPYTKTVLMAWFDIFSVGFTLFITFTVFPAIVVSLKSDRPESIKHVLPVIVIGGFQVFDAIGFPLTFFGFVLKGIVRAIVLIIRVAIASLVITCYLGGYKVFQSWLLLVSTVAVFGLLNGWSMSSGPNKVSASRDKQRVGFVSSFAGMLGIQLGSLVASLVQNIH